jgi:hypothetical protein
MDQVHLISDELRLSFFLILFSKFVFPLSNFSTVVAEPQKCGVESPHDFLEFPHFGGDVMATPWLACAWAQGMRTGG